MKRWIPMFVLVGALCLSVAAAAQGDIEIILNGDMISVAPGTTLTDLVTRLDRDPDDVDVTRNGNEVEERDFDNIVVQSGDRISVVEDESYDRFAFGIGVGAVSVDQDFIDDDVETYYMMSLRIALGSPDESREGSMRGYAEPEIAVWESDLISDTLIGVNLIGAFPYNSVDFFVGAGIGLHQFETRAFEIAGVEIPSIEEDALGFNAQFGVDIHVGETVSLFGAGRFDLIDNERDTVESKVYLGLRFSF